MPYIRHESLFSLQELYELEQRHRFEVIFSTVDITPIQRLVSKKSRYGAPVQIDCSAMIYSLIARIVERIPTIKDLVRRLNTDIGFRLDCGFIQDDTIAIDATHIEARDQAPEKQDQPKPEPKK